MNPADWTPCSGQSRGKSRRWGLYSPSGPAWARALDKAGRVRLFGSCRGAQKAADKLNETATNATKGEAE